MNIILIAGLAVAAMSPQTGQTDTTFAVHSDARVHIETFAGDITVKSWDKNTVHVVATHGRREYIDINGRGGFVKIEAEGRMGPPANVHMEVTVPSSVSVELSGVNTDMSVDGVTGDVDAETVQGTITVSGG